MRNHKEAAWGLLWVVAVVALAGATALAGPKKTNGSKTGTQDAGLATQPAPEGMLPDSPWKYPHPDAVGLTGADSGPEVYPPIVRPPAGAPNIVLVLVDDAGFGQFSTFGGGVPSPTMDRLAAEGVRFNRFHTTALCSPTRASLITGRNHHKVNMGRIVEVNMGYDGYTSVTEKDTATIGNVLSQHGYATSWFGKNHNTPSWEMEDTASQAHWPSGFGFQYFYGFVGGDANQWEPTLWENNTRVPRSPDPDYHMIPDLVDHAIGWMHRVKSVDPQKPYLLYMAPGATHAPHSAPEAWIAKFKGKFDAGWDEYRKQTFERQKRLGVVPASAKLTPRPPELPAWDSLTADQKKLYARMMEVFAAYGAFMDSEMGRLVDAVKAMPDADNTMIVYIAGDNGASAEGALDGTFNETAFFNGWNVPAEINMKYIDELGGRKVYNHFPAAWAWAMDTPFKWTKQVASHFGGIRNPVIVSWPKQIKDRGGLREQFTHVIDIAPTLYEAAGITPPAVVDGIQQQPIQGISMMYAIRDAKAESRRQLQYFEMFENNGLYHDGWFASSYSGTTPWAPPASRAGYDPLKATWELYDLEKDFTQANDVAAQNPEKLRELQNLWWAEAGKNDVLPLQPNLKFLGHKPLERPQYVLYPGATRIGLSNQPQTYNTSFTITAFAEVPASGAQGVLFAQGGVTGGMALYVQDGRLVYTYNFLDAERTKVTSTIPVPRGKVTMKADFAYDGGGPGKGGTVTLSVNGKPAGKGKIERTVPALYAPDEGTDVGMDEGSAVDFGYTAPFAFTGTLEKVVVDIKAPKPPTAAGLTP